MPVDPMCSGVRVRGHHRFDSGRAHNTTDASITSCVPVAPQSCPVARALASSSGTTSTAGEPSKRTRRICRRPSRQACPTTLDGTERRTDGHGVLRVRVLLSRSLPAR